VGYRGRIKGETRRFLGGLILAKLCEKNNFSKLEKKNTKKMTVEKAVKILSKNCPNFENKPVTNLTKNCQNFNKKPQKFVKNLS
jgi:hypothetical protein